MTSYEKMTRLFFLMMLVSMGLIVGAITAGFIGGALWRFAAGGWHLAQAVLK